MNAKNTFKFSSSQFPGRRKDLPTYSVNIFCWSPSGIESTHLKWNRPGKPSNLQNQNKKFLKLTAELKVQTI
jgi:hypothetical protein